MPTVELALPHHRYPIHIAPDALAQLGEHVRAVAPHARAALFIDQAIVDTHGRMALQSLEQAGYDTATAVMPRGEQHKTLDTVRALYDALLDHHMERKSPVVALGGGITGDVAGFAAATYLRGVPLVQCPTTLLAMVDASVGGKVGVNVPQGKNLIGAFHQPHAVVIDPQTLRTLPERERRCGLAECVKHAMIRDAELFDWIEQHVDALAQLDADAMTELIERNVRIKAAVVIEDEKESGVRAHLNFGHTFAHAIESTTDYERHLHGEAVALGMVAATALAVERDMIGRAVLDRLVALLERIGLPVAAGDLPDDATLLGAMRLDKKVAGGRIRLVLPERLGAVTITDNVPDAAIAGAWAVLRR